MLLKIADRTIHQNVYMCIEVRSYQFENVGFVAQPSRPLYRGLDARRAAWGLYNKQFYRSNGEIANLQQPPVSFADSPL